jgi:hypothetical protein
MRSERNIDGAVLILAGRYSFNQRDLAEDDAARCRKRGAVKVRIVRMGPGRYADFGLYVLGGLS